MFMSAETLALLMGSGLDQDKILAIYKSLENDFRAVEKIPSTVSVTLEKRREYDRQRKREKRNSGGKSGGQDADTISAVPVESPVEFHRTSRFPVDGRNNLFPSDEETEERKTTGNSKKSVSSRLPIDWRPSPADRTFALTGGLTEKEIDDAADQFSDYWRGVSGSKGCKLDWPATWRNRVRDLTRGRQQGPRLAGFQSPGGGGQGPIDFAVIRARRRAERDFRE